MPERVLLIDDAPEIVSALTARLLALGYDVASASDGSLGLAAIRELHPDVILLDIRLPDLDGFAVCIQIKADPETAHIPVIFLSANVADNAQHKAIAVGGDAFLSKPYDFRDVIETIKSATTGHV